MRVLLIVDRYHWAYHSIAKNLVKYNDTGWRLDIEKAKKNKKRIEKIAHKYDYFFVIGWQNFASIDFLPKKKTLVGIHSSHAWDDHKTTPDHDVQPPNKLIKYLNKFLGVNAVSQRLTNLFGKAGVEKIRYTPNGADIELFKPVGYKPDKFYVGYSGTKKHDWRKGTTEFIIPAAKKSGVKCKLAMLKDKTHIPLEDMPDFYRQLSCYVCASSSEGFSLSVLEAASCGIPIVSTRVGGCTNLIEHGVNGFLCNRNIDEIAYYITRLNDDEFLWNRISYSIRRTVVDEYSWKNRSKDWFCFMKEFCHTE